MGSSLQNHFLIATPSLADPFFARRVIYLCDYSEKGAMGLVINHPLELTIKEMLEQIDLEPTPEQDRAELEQAVLIGGPVTPERGFVLHTPQLGWSSSLQLTDELMVTTSRDILKVLGTDQAPDHYRVFLGYSGWSDGQLEQEIKDNSWLVCPASADLIFTVPNDDRWQQAAARLGVDILRMGPGSGNA